MLVFLQDNSLFDYRLATLHFNAYLGQLNITVNVLKGYIYVYTGITATVEPLLTDTFIIRTPLNYEQLIQLVPEKNIIRIISTFILRMPL